MRSCFSLEDAAKLPPGVFSCEAKKTESSACDAIPSPAACAAASCKWCKSSAVPSGCFAPEEAKRLPPGAFECGSSSPARPAERPWTAAFKALARFVLGLRGGAAVANF